MSWNSPPRLRRYAVSRPTRAARLLQSSAPGATILIRILVGWVFLSEGVQKFLYPAEVGAGRFVRIGIPNADLVAPFVGATEVVCGTLVLLGLFTRLAVVPLLAIMVVALVTTKLPILLGNDLGPFQLRELSYYGIWGFSHEARTDLSMLLCSIFLLIVGSGRYAVDAWLSRRSLGR